MNCSKEIIQWKNVDIFVSLIQNTSLFIHWRKKQTRSSKKKQMPE